MRTLPARVAPVTTTAAARRVGTTERTRGEQHVRQALAGLRRASAVSVAAR